MRITLSTPETEHPGKMLIAVNGHGWKHGFPLSFVLSHQFINKKVPSILLGCFTRTKFWITTGCFSPQLTVGPNSTKFFFFI